MEDLVQIGKTLKTHGLAGEIKLLADDFVAHDIAGIEAIFIEFNKQKMPYFVDQVRGSFPELILKLEDINSKEQAQPLSNKTVYARRAQLTVNKDSILSTGMQYAALEGYTAQDMDGKRLGTIVEIVAYPKQEMAVLDTGTDEVLVPLNSIFVQQVDKLAKTVKLDLPEGLLDLNASASSDTL